MIEPAQAEPALTGAPSSSRRRFRAHSTWNICHDRRHFCSSLNDRLEIVRHCNPTRKLEASGDPCRQKRSEEHTSELQSRFDLVCRLLLEKKKKKNKDIHIENCTSNS